MGDRLTGPQDCETLKKGFNKLRDRYTQSVAKVSAMEDELNACRRESTQLGAQVTALQKVRRVIGACFHRRLRPCRRWNYSVRSVGAQCASRSTTTHIGTLLS